MIAMKREVAAKCMNHAGGQVFRGANVKLGNWRQVTVSQIDRVRFSRHTRQSVQSPLVVLELIVRKGGDFFYGKSSNENHFESV